MDTSKLCGQTMAFAVPPVVVGRAAVAGRKEAAGPLGQFFRMTTQDDSFGQDTWEKAEQAMQQHALTYALEDAGCPGSGLDFLFAGDLLNQCVASSFAARSRGTPFFGLYGACSTMGEGLTLAAMALDGGFCQRAGVVVSSHFCTAERQYRTPLEYGSQRTPTAQWTVTGAGAVVLARAGRGPVITHATVGAIQDLGITDTNNMGAAMTPAAYATLKAHFADTGRSPQDYDRIFTGDLGVLGAGLLVELFARDGVALEPVYRDCGALIYQRQEQDVHCGGSGCGCCASVLTGYILDGMARGLWKRILFCPTGALHSPTTAMQGDSIPGICHAVAIEAPDYKEDL